MVRIIQGRRNTIVTPYFIVRAEGFGIYRLDQKLKELGGEYQSLHKGHISCDHFTKRVEKILADRAR